MSELMEYKCPCCDGVVEFDSASQKMKCPYCDTEFDVEALQSRDEILNREANDSMEWQTSENVWEEAETSEMKVYHCQSCGGEIITDQTTAATHCPYCDNPVVMGGHFTGDLKPDYVIPFKLDKKAAKEAFLSHLNGKKLLPKLFKDENHIDEIKGIYVPFWLFDAEIDADILYRGTKVRVWEVGDTRYTETSHYSVERGGQAAFEHVPVDGSEKMPDDLMESIEPFDFSQAVDFQTAYLSGYLADRYDVDAEQSIKRANSRIKQCAEDAFGSTVLGYATVSTERSQVNIENGQTKYALYPVWILNTTWNNEKYTFAMNGQTGKFVGNLPIDKGIFLKWFALYGVCGFVAVYLFQMLLMLF